MKNNRYGQLKEIVTKNVMKDIDEVGHVSRLTRNQETKTKKHKKYFRL